MGGTGNTGQQGGYLGMSTPLGPSGPGWAGAAPAASAAETSTATPPALRPYETATASTGTLSTAPTANGPGPVTSPIAPNLGFPTGFNHTPYPTAAASVPTAAGPAPVTPTTTAPEDPTKPKESPMDWLYPGHLPMDFHAQAGSEFGEPWKYSATGPSHTAGYGAVGGFGGVAGRGPQQIGLQDQVIMPDMAAGTKLEGAEIDQRNRVRREDYDRYMKLYGVGYDLPAYQQALNGLVYETNMRNYTPGGGG